MAKSNSSKKAAQAIKAEHPAGSLDHADIQKDPNPIAIPPSVRQMIDDALAVEIEDAKKADALGYMSNTLAQVTLPHSATNAITYKRSNGRLTLKIRADEDYKMPYGSLPRLLLSWICSEAVTKRSRQIMLGNCQTDFIRNRLKIRSAGGEYVATIKRQALALFSSLISVDVRDSSSAIGIENILIAKRAFMFWNQKRPDEPALWESYMMLDQDFFDSIVAAPVPVDLRVLHALRKSPMAMDIYTWLVYRIFVLRVSGKPVAQIPWPALELQFGAGYAPERRAGESDAAFLGRVAHGHRNFRLKFQERLRSVLLFYPDARDAIEATSEYLQLKPCKLHIDPKVLPLP